jgi:hypothetical protein
MTKIQHVTFGVISNVRKSGDEEGVYFADVELSGAEGFPMETCLYCARSDDYAPTGKWVYQQIIDGNFSGDIYQLASRQDPETLEVMPDQPVSTGAQNL